MPVMIAVSFCPKISCSAVAISGTVARVARACAVGPRLVAIAPPAPPTSTDAAETPHRALARLPHNALLLLIIPTLEQKSPVKYPLIPTYQTAKRLEG